MLVGGLVCGGVCCCDDVEHPDVVSDAGDAGDRPSSGDPRTPV